MEYTKDVIFNVQYAGKVQTIKLRNKRWTSKLMKFCENNKFIIITICSMTILVVLDLCMVSNFVNLLVEL